MRMSLVKEINPNLVLLGIGAAAIGAVVYMLRTLDLKNAASGAVGAVGNVASGAVLGAGDVLGVPRTSMTECEKAKSEGRTWDASFACTAGNFLGYLFTGTPDPTAPTSAEQMRSYSYPGGATYPAREGSNQFLPDYVQGYGYEAPAPYRYDFTSK